MEAGVHTQTCMETVVGLDDQITNLIESRSHRTIRGLHVELDSNELLVTGFAPNYYSKQLATQAALEAVTQLLPSGAVAVNNQIEVL